MELKDIANAHGGQAGLARVLGCDKSYLNRVLKERRDLGPALAIRVYRATGHRLGPIADASPDEIDMMERLIPKRGQGAQ